MKKTLLAGLAFLLPIALTLMIASYLINFFIGPFVAASYTVLIALHLPTHAFWVITLSYVSALAALLLLILVLGVLGRKVFFCFFLQFTDKIFLKIPFVRTIYRLFQDITKALFSEKEKGFKQTVLLPFPSASTHALGFVTGEVPEGIKKVVQEADLTVFVPTSPYPLSGFLLLTPKKYAVDVDATVEEGFKFLLSCGKFHPGEELQ